MSRARDNASMLSSTQTLTNKTFVAPALGTPASGVMTNMTGAVTASMVDDAVTGAKIENNPTIAGNLTVTGDLVPSTPLSHRNHLINGDFQVNQRWPSYTAGDNNDDTYVLDRWYLLSDSNNVVDVTQSSTAPTNQLYSIGLDVETADKKFGIAQIIENKNCVGLIGNNVTFSFKAKVSATTKLDNVKAGIIAWSGTADSVTSDVVSAWAVEGTNPTLAANLTFENTPANLNVTTSWATYSVSANIDTSSTTNVIVFIWSDVTDTSTGDFLYITDCQLEQGSNATPFEHRSFGDELARCLRYYQLMTSTGDSAQIVFGGVAQHNSTDAYWVHRFLVPFRAAPTLELTLGSNFKVEGNNTSATITDLYINGGWGSPQSQGSAYGIRMFATVSGTQGTAGWLTQTATGGYMAFTAEL